MARTWEWRMRSWAGTRSQRGLAEARVTLVTGVEAGPGTISQRGFSAWATNCQPGAAGRAGAAWDRGFAVPRAALGRGGRGGGGPNGLAREALARGGRGGGGPRVQVKAAAGWAAANSSRKAAGTELAIDPAQQTPTLLAEPKELGPQGKASSCGGRLIGLIRFPINFGIAISLI